MIIPPVTVLRLTRTEAVDYLVAHFGLTKEQAEKEWRGKTRFERVDDEENLVIEIIL